MESENTLPYVHIVQFRNHNNRPTCAGNQKICDLKSRTLQWRHLAAKRKT